MVPKPLMSVAEYAVHRGCSDSYVRRMRREKRLKLTTDGQIDVVGSDALLASTSDPLRGGDRTGKPDTDDVDPAGFDATVAKGDVTLREAMRRERLARARLAELELGEASKQLARVKDVERDVFTLTRQALETLRAMPSKLRNALAAESNPRACEALIDAEVAKVCAAMHKAALSMAGGPNSEGEAE
jgi:hypothetical protein